MLETNIAEYSILKKRFEPGFFNNYLCSNLLFLFDLSDRFHQDPAEMSKEFLGMLYTEKLDVLSQYKSHLLEQLIYGDRNEISKKEMCFVESGQFFLAYVHAFLSMKSFPDENIKEELFRLIGLLIVNTRPNLGKKGTDPLLIDLTNGVFKFHSETKLLESIQHYAAEFKMSGAHLNRIKGFGRSYISETNEFDNFLAKFPVNYQKYLSPQLKDVLVQAYRDYRRKSCISDTGLINYIQTNPPYLKIYTKLLAKHLNAGNL